VKNLQTNHPVTLPPKIIFWGGTGQAKVNRPIVEYYGSKVVAVFDDTPGLKSPFSDVEMHQGWEGFLRWKKSQKEMNDFGFCIAIGNPHGRVRLKLHERLVNEGLHPISLIHPTAFIDETVLFDDGLQVMAGAIIQPEVRIGRQCIINTKVSVDHECILEDGVELAPGVTLCGNVYVETNGWICAGATVLPRMRIGHDSIVGAGSVVIRDIPSEFVAYGIPAKNIRRIIFDERAV
jgi:sugar O-acyltransferase, sialic acid O-acetyltransferase NeuD family